MIFKVSDRNYLVLEKPSISGYSIGIIPKGVNYIDYANKKSRLKEIRNEERRLISELLDVPEYRVVNLIQIHGNSIFEIGSKDSFDIPVDGVDGIFAHRKLGFLFVIVTADCIPSFWIDESTGFYGALHSGWRGLKEGIVENMVELFLSNGSSPSSIKIIALPFICKKHYEVGNEFRNYFEYGIFKEKDKFFLDLGKEFKSRLLKNGIPEDNIFISSFCTYEENFLFSYRRDRENCGRNLNFIYPI